MFSSAKYNHKKDYQKSLKSRGGISVNLLNRAKYVLNGEDGAISVEMVGWIAIICIVLLAAFLLRDQIVSAVNSGSDAVKDLNFDNLGGTPNGRA